MKSPTFRKIATTEPASCATNWFLGFARSKYPVFRSPGKKSSKVAEGVRTLHDYGRALGELVTGHVGRLGRRAGSNYTGSQVDRLCGPYGEVRALADSSKDELRGLYKCSRGGCDSKDKPIDIIK